MIRYPVFLAHPFFVASSAKSVTLAVSLSWDMMSERDTSGSMSKAGQSNSLSLRSFLSICVINVGDGVDPADKILF